MTLDEAKWKAKETGSWMVYRESKAWHHRGILTDFNDSEDVMAIDWKAVEGRTVQKFSHTFSHSSDAIQ